MRCERIALPAELYPRGKTAAVTEARSSDVCVHTEEIPVTPGFPVFSGSKEARTPDLSRVRRTLIPAELCFRVIWEYDRRLCAVSSLDP